MAVAAGDRFWVGKPEEHSSPSLSGRVVRLPAQPSLKKCTYRLGVLESEDPGAVELDSALGAVPRRTNRVGNGGVKGRGPKSERSWR